MNIKWKKVRIFTKKQAISERAKSEQAKSEWPKPEQAKSEWPKSEQTKSEQAKSEQAKSEQLKFPQITASSMELFFQHVQRMGWIELKVIQSQTTSLFLCLLKMNIIFFTIISFCLFPWLCAFEFHKSNTKKKSCKTWPQLLRPENIQNQK